MEQKMVERAFNNANKCEENGDLAGKEKWLAIALLAEIYYINKEKEKAK